MQVVMLHYLSPKTIHITPLLSQQLPLLQQLSISTFNETFAATNAPENMKAYMDKAFDMQQLEREFKHQESAFFLLWIDEQAQGYLKLNWGAAQTEQHDPKAMEIERIYLKQACHGQGYAQLLIELALEQARNKGCSQLWLGVWEHNPRAIAFYEKCGFTVFATHPFFMGEEQQTDLLMQRGL
jgi:diamine N-acetyltransferase